MQFNLSCRNSVLFFNFFTLIRAIAVLLFCGCSLCDEDGDNYFSNSMGCFNGRDCNDYDPKIRPDAFEDPTDNVDNDCDNLVDETSHCDLDDDGFFSVECRGSDCDDDNRKVFPEALEDPFDETDNDCDNETDEWNIDCDRLPMPAMVPRDGEPFTDCRVGGPEIFGRYDYTNLPLPIRIPVIAHVFHDPRITAASHPSLTIESNIHFQNEIEDLIRTTLKHTSEMFSEMNVSFFLAETSFPQGRNLAFADLAPDQEFESMRRRFFVPNMINLFYVTRVNAGNPQHSWAGHSSGPHAEVQHIILELRDSSFHEVSSIVGHEIGHLFDLNHTHENRYGVSLANTPDDYQAGDLLADTPADPGSAECEIEYDEDTQSCSIIECNEDTEGNRYAPNPANIMSYHSDLCGSEFSHEQMQVMLCSIFNHFPSFVVQSAQQQCRHFCGDNEISPWEECDDGNSINEDACSNECTAYVCGNGIVEGLEQCDDGNHTNIDFCKNNCFTSLCGDGIVQADEECDDGNPHDTDFCSNDCTITYCGDGFLKHGVEDCDDGNELNGDTCDRLCFKNGLSECGNGIVEHDELCDEGEQNGQLGVNCDIRCTQINHRLSDPDHDFRNGWIPPGQFDDFIFESNGSEKLKLFIRFGRDIPRWQIPLQLIRIDQNGEEIHVLQSQFDSSSNNPIQILQTPSSGRFILRLQNASHPEPLDEEPHDEEIHRIEQFAAQPLDIPYEVFTIEKHRLISEFGQTFSGVISNERTERFLASTRQLFGRTHEEIGNDQQVRINLRMHIETDTCPRNGLYVSVSHKETDLFPFSNFIGQQSFETHLPNCQSAVIRNIPVRPFYRIELKAVGQSPDETFTYEALSFSQHIDPVLCGNRQLDPGEACDQGEQNGQVGASCDTLCSITQSTLIHSRYEIRNEPIPWGTQEVHHIESPGNEILGIKIHLRDSLPESFLWPLEIVKTTENPNRAQRRETVFLENIPEEPIQYLIPLDEPATYNIYVSANAVHLEDPFFFPNSIDPRYDLSAVVFHPLTEANQDNHVELGYLHNQEFWGTAENILREIPEPHPVDPAVEIEEPRVNLELSLNSEAQCPPGGIFINIEGMENAEALTTTPLENERLSYRKTFRSNNCRSIILENLPVKSMYKFILRGPGINPEDESFPLTFSVQQVLVD